MSPAFPSYRSPVWYAVALLGITGCQDRGLPTAAPGSATFDASLANTCEVTSAADDGPGTLRARVADPACNTITFAAALHGGTIVLTSGQISIARDLAIAGPGAGQLDVSGDGRSRVFSIAAGSTVAIEGLTVTAGADSEGGGIFNQGTLQLSGTIVSDNFAPNAGGIWNDHQGVLTITHSTISGNSAGETGAAGGIGNLGVLEVVHSTVRENEAQIAGGISSGGPAARATITHSRIVANRAEIAAGGISNGGTLVIADSEISGNSSWEGGGLWNGGTLELTRSTVSGNLAGDFGGGGIWNDDRGVLTITHSTISSNEAFDIEGGGGILNRGVLRIFNTTLAHNIAWGGGGGAVANQRDGNLAITGGTLAHNDAGSGSAIDSRSSQPVMLRNTIVANSREGGNCAGTIIDGGYNIEDEASCGFSEANGSFPNTDPLLDPEGLQDNGGPTRTIALLPGSPAVDAIPFGASGCGTTNTTDQRGVNRPQGPGCDIGAFELEQPPCTAVTLDRIGTDPDVPGEIRLGSPFVEAVFFDVEAFLPRSAARPLGAQAEDVRWGPTWETGTPAHSFRLADETGDGQRDAVIRFETGRLVAEGNLSLQTRRVTLWGSDRAGGQLYCASAAVRVVP
jgi:fibronectin-binding autotransporter adhesin